MICPPLHSHLRAFEAIADALHAQGHQALFINEARTALSPGHVLQSLPPDPDPQQARGFMADIKGGARRSDRLCRFGPDILRQVSPDLILGDQTEPAAGLLARALDLPMLSVACALPFDPEPGIPLPFLGWPYDPSPRGLRRQEGGERVARVLMTPHRRIIASWADRWRLGPLENFADCLSPLGTLAQTVPGFDYPRPLSGGRIAQLGPFRRDLPGILPPHIVPDPARPLVYVSLGTLQGHRWRLLARIARACRDLRAQVLVSHGKALDAGLASRIPADWVCDFVPQRAVLARADLCVTHAGLNTTLECVEQGVPMLAVPLAHDQPGVAARIEHGGLGLRLGPWGRSERAIRVALGRLLSEPGFRINARRLAEASDPWPGAAGAVERIELAMASPIPDHGAVTP